jgi:dolichol-phosphate mannosyltransferase
MMTQPIELSVLLPAYNEAERLRTNLLEVLRTLDEAPADAGTHPFELILVDDGSSDDTASIARAVAQIDDRVRVVSYAPNAGKGAALHRGFEVARGNLVAFLDADLDLHPRLLLDLLQVLRTQNADVVIGSKRHPASHVDYPVLRRLYSAAYFGLTQLLFNLPVHDTQTGIKLFKREVLQNAFPRMQVRQYAFDLELLALANLAGARIAEAPVTVTSQRLSQRIHFGAVVTMFVDTLKIWWRLCVRHR